MKKSLLLISASILMVTIGCQSDDDEFYMEAQYKNDVEKGYAESLNSLQENTENDKGVLTISDSIPDKDLIPWRDSNSENQFQQENTISNKGVKTISDSIPDKDLIPWRGTQNQNNNSTIESKGEKTISDSIPDKDLIPWKI